MRNEPNSNSLDYDVYAVIGEWLVSQLAGHDDAARAVFDAIVPRYSGETSRPNPVMHKHLTHILLQHVEEEGLDALEDRMRGLMWPALVPALADGARTGTKESEDYRVWITPGPTPDTVEIVVIDIVPGLREVGVSSPLEAPATVAACIEAHRRQRASSQTE